MAITSATWQDEIPLKLLQQVRRFHRGPPRGWQSALQPSPCAKLRGVHTEHTVTLLHDERVPLAACWQFLHRQQGCSTLQVALMARQGLALHLSTVLLVAACASTPEAASSSAMAHRMK